MMKTRQRGFEIISTYQEQDIHLPVRATIASAGYDIEASEAVTLGVGETVLIKTGLKAYMLEDEVLQIYVRSSLASKRGLILSNSVGIIDADYYNNASNEGHILIALTNNSSGIQQINKHERIAQGIFMKYLKCDDDQVLTGARSGGFGSSNG
jgi:dUTP pyrophosphatase